MIKQIPIEKILFLDIETVSQKPKWEELSDTEKFLWNKKAKSQLQEGQDASEVYFERAGIFAEFGKIVCISVGKVEKSGRLKIKSYADRDELILLQEFGELFNHSSMRGIILCAHNGKEFDFPWISRRYLINGMQPPQAFQNFGKKPWEIPHLDTLELWKFGEYRSFVSLELLSHVLGLPSPKDDIDGSMVSSIFHIDKDLIRIIKYCEKDVLTLANVFCRLRQEPILERY